MEKIENVGYPFHKQALVFTCLQYMPFENTVLITSLSENFRPLLSNKKLSSANSFTLGESKICRLGMGYQGFPLFSQCFPKPSFLVQVTTREFLGKG